MFRAALSAKVIPFRAQKRVAGLSFLMIFPALLLVVLHTSAGTSDPPAWQTPYVIKNIAGKTEDLVLFYSAANDDIIVFSADGPPQSDVFTQELWRTDGTAANTILLEDTVDRVYGQPVFLGDQIILPVRDDNDDSDVGEELWTSDGTPGGAKLLADLAPGRLSSSPAGLTQSGPYVFFAAEAYDGNYSLGLQLWRTDGTTEGTIRLTGKDLNFDLYVTMPQWPDEGGIADYNGVAYVLAISADPASPNAQYLLRSDGSVAGTTIVTELAGIVGYARSLDGSGPVLFFQGGHVQLWRSDGTQQGTSILHQVTPGREITALASADSAVYYVVRDEAWKFHLWKSTGVAASNELVKSLEHSPRNLVTQGNMLLFFSSDTLHGLEPWISDGTAVGTKLLKDIVPGNGDSVRDYELRTIVAGDHFYFAAASSFFQDFNPPFSIWRSDGTTAGTDEVLLGLPPEGDPRAYPLQDFRGELFFLASDNAHGLEPWLTVNGGATAHFVKDINAIDPVSSMPRVLNYTNDFLFFLAVGDLWRSDGSDVGTSRVVDADYVVTELVGDADSYGTAGDWLYFLIRNIAADRTEFWRTNGTPGSTASIGYWPGTSGPSRAHMMTGIDNLLYFVHSLPSGSEQLWHTDGTNAGTIPVFGLDDPSGKNATKILEIAGDMDMTYFVIDNWYIGRELLVTDGTPEGTTLVKDIVPGEGLGSDPQDLVMLNHLLYFSANDGIHGRELWRSDGTAAGTVMVKDIQPGPQGSDPVDLSIFNGAVYFSADDAVHNRELWRSDGTASGTFLFLDTTASAVSSGPLELTPGLDWMYFVGWDPDHSYQLWKTDGSFASTKRVTNFVIDTSHWPHHLAVVDNTVFFLFGVQLSGIAYQSDGTAEGTFSHQEMFPDSGFYGDYREMTAAPGRLFFAAPNALYGDEPSALMLSLALMDPNRLALAQGGGWKHYDLTLNFRPNAPVTIEITGTNGLEIGPNKVTFTPDNWNIAQVINVRAPSTRSNTESGPATISHKFITADSMLNGEVATMPIQINQWRFGYLPTIIR